MAKTLLADFKIGGDIIDRVSPMADKLEKALTSLEESLSNSVETTVSAESPPVDGTLDTPEEPIKGSTPFTLNVKKDGLFQVFTLSDTTYRVGGIKPLFVTSLRVNLRASQEEKSYYDTLDLYSAKARTSYAGALNRSWGIDPSRVEKDLVTILEHLEAERDRQLTVSSQKPHIEISPSDREAGLQLLRDPRLFDRIAEDLSSLGYVGEDLNKALLYLCASSRKLDDPISVLILSQSASGKSFLVDCVKKLMPPEDVVAVTSLSDQALNYLDDLMHKFLVLGEAVHGDVVDHQIREMLSGKELSRLVTIKDVETGKMASRVMRTPVVVASVMSGTNHSINPENASRAFVINTDESREQTRAIHQNQRLRYSLDRLNGGAMEVSAIIKIHQAAQRILEKVAIVNDFAPLLDFPVNLMRLRRDHDRFLDLIACVCFLRQFQKPAEFSGATRFVRCDLEDYRIAYRIMIEGVMSSTVRELPKGAVGLYEELRAWVRKEAVKQKLQPEEVSFTQRQIREATGLGHTWVQVSLRQLVEYEYVVLVSGGGIRSKAVYRLRGDEGITGADLSMIPTPEKMEKSFREARK